MNVTAMISVLDKDKSFILIFALFYGDKLAKTFVSDFDDFTTDDNGNKIYHKEFNGYDNEISIVKQKQFVC